MTEARPDRQDDGDTRRPPLTRDAAEGAEPSIDWLAKEIAEKATLMMTGQASYLQHIVKCAEWIRDRYAATPKPAPDAMQEMAKRIKKEWPCCAHDRRDEIVASLSAPVPSPDGAIKRAITLIDDYDRHGSMDHGIAFELKRILPPSATGAAEPGNAQMLEYARRLNDIAVDVELAQGGLGGAANASDLRRIAQQIATPPVRGDRTRINSAADEVVRRVAEYDDRTSPDDFPEALLITPSELHAELTRFADDLSLPVQPGAGERTHALLKQLAFYYDVNDCQQRNDDDALEVPIRDLKEAKNLFAALSRQAPHSSREGGR